jgi:tRNA modification GTPase
LEAAGKRLMIALNKIDLGIKVELPDEFGGARFPISALTGEGLDGLKSGLVRAAFNESSGDQISSGLINSRHKECLVRAAESLKKAAEGNEARQPQDLIAIDLKSAIIALGEISGLEVSDEVIDSIFENFCVGK